MSLVKIQGNASGTGEFTIAAPNSNTNRTLTLPDVTGTFLTSATTTGFPAGSVIQVVSTIKTDTFSTTSGSLTDITGMSVSITPTSTTSKILIQFSLGQAGPAAAAAFGVALLRGSTVIGAGDTAGSRISTSIAGIADGDRSNSQSFCFLDSPSTTSSTTYKLQIYVNSGNTVYINRSTNDSNSSVYARTASTITVMEIAA